MGLTTDPNDPRLGHGADAEPRDQHEVYLVLSASERAKGFVRPLRRSYRHVGPVGPAHPMRELTADERARFAAEAYVAFEIYPESSSPATGRFWTQAELDAVGRGCGAVTSMGLELCETYARDQHFYGSTYCTTCRKHLPVAEFAWVEDGARVGS